MKSHVEEVKVAMEKVDSLKGRAQTNRDFGDYSAALEDLDNAIAHLDSTLKALETDTSEQVETLRYKLARELGDCYGMKGGIYRRQDDLENAEATYEAGRKYEQDFNIPDTYNRTNVIVLRLLRDPHDHAALRPIILDCWEIVHDQIKGKNKNKWWAWADFGLLNLLRVNLEETEDQAHFRQEARNAYEQFKKNGAGMQHFESTIEVLTQLRQGFHKIGESTELLIQEEIDYLKANMP